MSQAERISQTDILIDAIQSGDKKTALEMMSMLSRNGTNKLLVKGAFATADKELCSAFIDRDLELGVTELMLMDTPAQDEAVALREMIGSEEGQRKRVQELFMAELARVQVNEGNVKRLQGLLPLYHTLVDETWGPSEQLQHYFE